MTHIEDTVREHLKNKNPGQALVALAGSVDALWATVNEDRAEDPWSVGEAARSVEELELQGLKNIADATHQSRASDHIIGLRNLLHETADPDERIAIEAKIRLATDGQRAELGVDPVPDGARAVVVDEDDAQIIELPPATPELRKSREQFAPQLFAKSWLKDLYQEDCIDAYVRGGPLWLYHGDREFVMGLPDDYRHRMVEDVLACGAYGEALEMGRDILKDATATPANYEDLSGRYGD